MMRCVFIVILGLCLSACISSEYSDIHKRTALEDTLDTKITNHAQAFPLQLHYDGIILSLEKSLEEKVCQQCDYRVRQPENDAAVAAQAQHFQRVINRKDKYLYISHAYRHFNFQVGGNKLIRGTHCLFNIYDVEGRQGCAIPTGDPKTAELKTWELLNTLEGIIRDEVVAGDYTHLFVMSTGWNNLQYDSFKQYNSIMRETEEVFSEHKEGAAFKPFVIGLTWDSIWGERQLLEVVRDISHLASYGNKADDADEVGYGIVNHLINNTLAGALSDADRDLPVIAIGHSFGARLLSRALISADYLENPKSDVSTSVVDLFVGLQPAFDAGRFIKNYRLCTHYVCLNRLHPSRGLGEGGPYSDFSGLNMPWLLTSSEGDSSNASAFWLSGSRHLGGPRGLRYVRKASAKPEPLFATPLVWKAPDQERALCSALSKADRSKVQVVDATGIIVDHNDVEDRAIGELLYCSLTELIDR